MFFYHPLRLIPPNSETLLEDIRRLSIRFPFLRVSSIGKSLLGKDLYRLELGNPQNEVLYAGAFHGMEWITTLILLNFAYQLCYALENHLRLQSVDIFHTLEQTGISIIPCVNPDGVDIMLHGAEAAGNFFSLVQEISGGDTERWQANARGVDLNHNFNAGWFFLRNLENAAGITGPAATRYGGTAPESEPESAALARLCRHTCFRFAIAFHSQGEEIYYHYGSRTPKRSLSMAKALSAFSGYRLSEPEGLASMGGFKDWFIDRLMRPAFTVEVGLGKNPLPIEDFWKIYPRLEPMLVGALLL